MQNLFLLEALRRSTPSKTAPRVAAHRQPSHRRPALAAVAASLLVSATLGVSAARAGVMMQGFYWDVPSPGAGTQSAPWWWDVMRVRAKDFSEAGFTAVWIPPVLKGASGGNSNGYDPYDDYDLGNKNQNYTFPTRYGTREQLTRAVATLRSNGLAVYVDIVNNHRSGDDGNYNFYTANAYGVWQRGRFQKGRWDFHPNVPQDPNVPDGNNESSFGRDLAPMNGASGYAYNGLLQSGDWMVKALDVQGFRLDYVKGMSTNFVNGWLNYGAMAGKFAVGEYWDGNRDTVNYWVQTSLQNRASAFDFPLRYELKDMCQAGGYYDMRRLDHAGLAGINPGGAVTWVENHDTDRSDPITQNKLLAYAYILTSEGYPCVFYRDWSDDPGCYNLKTRINTLVWIHEKIASGATVERWKDNDVFAYERTGGQRLLVGLNDNGVSERTVTVQTGWGANTLLRDYTGAKPDIYTDAQGRATITIPKNVNGNGYVCYSGLGKIGAIRPLSYAVTQEFAGADDLDIKPADNTQLVQADRIIAQSGTKITTALYYDTKDWTDNTKIALQIVDVNGVVAASQEVTKANPQGASLQIQAARSDWYAFQLRSYNTPTTNPRPAYWLKVTYKAPVR